MQRRSLLTAGLGLAALSAMGGRGALAAAAGQDLTRDLRGGQQVPHRRARVVRMFKTPDGFPNGIRSAPEGFWVAEQRTLTEPLAGKTNNIYLMDMNGRVLRTLKNEGANISGLGYGGGSLWVGNNAFPNGILQYDVQSGELVSHRQIPLGGGGCHGVMYHAGKVYLTALRVRGIMRVDAASWEPEFLIPYSWPRTHELEWDNGYIWMVTGTLNGPSPNDDRAGLAKYNAATGQLVETVSFDGADFDPHGLTIKDGVLYTCDAGIHPGWPDSTSPGSGYVGRIEFI